MRDLVLGIDLGTSACKALLADLDGRVLSIGSAGYPTYSPQAAWAEQDADEVWRGMLVAVRQALQEPDVDRRRIAALSFSAALHGLLPLDAAGRPLMRCLIWADRRSQPQAQRLRQEHDAHALYLRTGCPLQPLYWPAKLLWLREQRPDVARAAQRYVAIKDYVIQRLTGRCVTDLSIASGTGLLNTHTLTWEAPLLDLLGVAPEQLPELVAPEEVLGTLAPSAADELGLPHDVQVVAGGSDGGLANLGAGAVGAGHMATTIGTSGAVRAVTEQPHFDAQERTWCYVLRRGQWFVGGAINNGGVVYAWLRDGLARAQAQEAERLGQGFGAWFDACAAQIPPGAEGLLFLPFLLGERSPGWHANAHGVLFGLGMQHTDKHVIRAAVEGVAMRLYGVLDALQASLGVPSEMRVTGGLAESPLWMKVLADVYGLPIHIPALREASALGAIFVALQALGHLRDESAARARVPIVRVQESDPVNHALYMRQYRIFQSIYQDALPRFDELECLANEESGGL